MKKIEYKVVKLDISGGFFSMGGKVDTDELQTLLTSLGNEGWELVNTFDTAMTDGRSRNLVMIFKKERL